ncbi:MAG: ABC transporter ATP-binding protein [Planctomycetaceae bacterium]
MISKTNSFVIDLEDVAKTYRRGVRALKGISMQVHPGEIFGLLGPNGAGKSTLVKILMTIIHPTRCYGTLLGKPVGTKSVLARVGYLPEHLKFPDYLTGKQVLNIYGALAKVPRAERHSRGEALLELVGMHDWADKRVGTYSKGMKQRIGLAQALINDPELVLLDEPTDGVDPMGRRDIREVLLQMKQEGKTVFVNSHLLSELEMVCDRIAILSKGNVIQQGRIDDLTSSSKRYEITLASPLPKNESLQKLLSSMQAEVVTSASKTNITIPNDNTEIVQPLIDELRKAGAMIESLKPVRQSLEDYFIQAVDEAGDGTPGGD